MNQISLKPGLSLYLDLFRLTLALIVVVFHANISQMGGSWFRFPLDGSAVLGFFVLSGFVISYVAATKERDAATYGIARLARLWSVLLPALALTPLFDAIGRMFSPSIYEGWGIYLGFDHPLLRLAASAAFLNELWFWSIPPLSDGPVWSLGFEAWYYALFGAFIFSRGKTRAGLICLIGLIAGPKILLLFPSWLLGVWLYSSREKFKLNRLTGAVLFIACPVLIAVLKSLHVEVLLMNFTKGLIDPNFFDVYIKYARLFIWQNLVGVLITAHLAGAMVIADDLEQLLAPVSRVIRIAAGYTLSIYLLHHPIEMMIAAILHNHPDGPVKTTLVISGAVTLAVFIGFFIEPRRYWLKALLSKWYESFLLYKSRRIGTLTLLPASEES